MKTEILKGKQALFEATDWAVIYGAQTGDLEARRKLWDTYARPAKVLLFCRGVPEQEAEDVLQGFFLHLFGGAVEKVDKTRGTFRSWFRAALSHFVSSARRTEHAKKRGGGCEIVSVSDHKREEDDDTADLDIPAGKPAPDDDFDRAFAVAVFSRVYAKLRKQWEKAGKGVEFRSLWEALFAEWGSQARSAAGDPRKANQLKAKLFRLRRQLVALAKEEVCGDHLSAVEKEAEFDYLLTLWVEQKCKLEEPKVV